MTTPLIGPNVSRTHAAPRRVLMIVQNLPLPFDRRVWTQAKTLRQAGYEVAVICPRGKFATEPYVCLEGVHIYRHPLPLEAKGKLGYVTEYSTALAWEFYYALKVLRRHGFDVIHACNPPDLIYLVAMIFKKTLGKKFIFDHHDLNPELYEAKFGKPADGKTGTMYEILTFFERRTFNFADISIATNDSYARIARERGAMPADRVFTVRSGPNIAFVKPRPPDDAWKKGRKFLVAYVGVIGDQEGIDLLVDAVGHLVAQGRNDIQTVIMGTGPSWDTARALIDERKLGDYITLTGRVDDETLFTVLSTADVCVNPDRPNAMNDLSTMNKIMEYMACGKPIVQFDLTEGRVSARDASLYAKNTDTADFASKIMALMDDPERRAAMGAFGFGRVRNDLSWTQEAPKLLAAYDAVYALPPRWQRNPWWLRAWRAISGRPQPAGAALPVAAPAIVSATRLNGAALVPSPRSASMPSTKDKLIELGKKARANLPAWLALHPDYFAVRRLLTHWHAGNRAEWEPQVRDRFRGVLAHAIEHVPHYRDIAHHERLTGDMARHENPAELIKRFPLLTKAEIIATPDRFVSEKVPSFLRYQKASSGSSGQGILLWRTKGAADCERAFLDHLWAPWNFSAEHARTLRMSDEARRPLTDSPFGVDGNRLLVSPNHLNDTWLPEIYERVAAFNPEFVHSYTSCIYALAKYIVDTGRAPIRVKAVLLTSEPLPQRWIGTLHKAFQADLSIHYGLTERTNFAEATLAPGNGELCYTVNPVYGFQENYVHGDGRAELVGTSYWNTVMPLIRYRTGDFGTIRDGLIRDMGGRDLEWLFTRDGKPIAGLLVEPEPIFWQYVEHFQIYQPANGRLVFRVVPKPGTGPSDLARILDTFRPLWSSYFDMEIEPVARIARTAAGKTPLIVRDRAHSGPGVLSGASMATSQPGDALYSEAGA